MRFATLRLIIVSLATGSQVYLFLRLRQAIRSLNRSERFKSLCIRAGAVAMISLSVAELYIVSTTFTWVDPPFAVQLFFLYPPTVWIVGGIMSAALLLIAQLFAGTTRFILRSHNSPSSPQSPSPSNAGRRRFLKAGMGSLASAPFLLCGYGAVSAAESCQVRELNLPFGRSLRVVQLTDIHAGVYMTRAEMRRFADKVNALHPDVFVLTGDYITNSMVFFQGCAEEMARVRTRYGTFASMGNHDHWHGDLAEFRRIFQERGIHLLVNSRQEIRTGQGAFAIAGIDDLLAGDPDLKATLHGLDSSTPTILLSHRPEIFPEAAARGVPLTLSGHYHGGQIKVPLAEWGVSLAHLRTPYAEGLFRINSSRLYVSRGIGSTFTPIRLNVPPEITLLHLA